jgi:hypothetical protein
MTNPDDSYQYHKKLSGINVKWLSYLFGLFDKIVKMGKEK